MTYNEKFEENLAEACLEHLNSTVFDIPFYVKATLDEMWDGEEYSSEDGASHYYEIPTGDTKSGNPYVVTV